MGNEKDLKSILLWISLAIIVVLALSVFFLSQQLQKEEKPTIPDKIENIQQAKTLEKDISDTLKDVNDALKGIDTTIPGV